MNHEGHEGHEGEAVSRPPFDPFRHAGVSPEVEKIAAVVVDAGLKVHSQLGPGLLESVYEICLAHELRKRGLAVERQVERPVIYDGVRIEVGMRLDLLVGNSVVVEIKAVTDLLPIHQAQVITYLRLTGLRVGFLMNFHEAHLRDGIKRLVV